VAFPWRLARRQNGHVADAKVREDAARWRWSNVPLPEPYLAALAAGIALSRIRPLLLPIPPLVGQALGWPLVAGGIAFAGWAVASSGTTDVDRPGHLVTTGAYAVSRNPMYLGWSVAMLGAAALGRNGWLVIGTLLAAAAIRREILREETTLSEAFGSEFEAYRSRVGRVAGSHQSPI
jgi:protein-S-isoprenylcysteine O-methyltransferase Ste14